MTDRLTRVVFCLPGNNFSGRFLECWTDLIAACLSRGVQPIVSRRQSCNIYYVRNMCLGAEVTRGKDQKPFDGKLDYDYLMWIDSDILFRPEQFFRLLEHRVDIVSGIYAMEGGNAFATVKDWDEEYFKKNGCFRFLTSQDLDLHPGPLPVRGEGDRKGAEVMQDGLIEVAYTGMGFMMVRKGVFETLEYPWFKPVEKKIGDIVDFTMEDVAFCLGAREKGFRVMVDPSLRVGHEKTVVL